MVMPNALVAFYYAAKGRADIVHASQVGDGHVCIPLCPGLSAVLQPMPVPAFFGLGRAILLDAALVHIVCVVGGALPRWMGWPLLAAWAWSRVRAWPAEGFQELLQRLPKTSSRRIRRVSQPGRVARRAHPGESPRPRRRPTPFAPCGRGVRSAP